jgi:hypothetical protein
MSMGSAARPIRRRVIVTAAPYLGDYLRTIPGPIVLVGHSHGGAVITNATTATLTSRRWSTRTPLYRRKARRSCGSSPPSRDPASPVTRECLHHRAHPGIPAGDVDLYLKTTPDPPYPGFAQCFANGLPAGRAGVLAATQRPLAFSAASTLSCVPAWQTIPSWSVIGAADHALPPAEQLFMSQRAKAHITEIGAGHLSVISDPGGDRGHRRNGPRRWLSGPFQR